ncbi:hypothetical protein [Pelagibacterium halotolerans]|uniref:hypothetical protein n=1 Tax=Pelagibacterium halotolerans TaxID=531813 RepID=UPI00384B62C5
MGKMFATANTKIFIGGVTADQDTDFVEADFSGETWTEIGGTTNLGQIGDTAELITSNQITRGRTKKAKGTFNAGSMAIVCDLDPDDAGQTALAAAGGARDNYAFKIEFDDAPSGGTPSTRYFIGLVMGTPEVFEDANSAKKLNTTIEVNSNIVKVAAAAGI